MPHAFAVPAPSSEALRGRVPASVLVPGATKRTAVTEVDAQLVLEAIDWFVGFVAESLPAQILTGDAKTLLPGIASALAVMACDGEHEWLGSFDLMVRIHAKQNADWKKYHGCTGVIDVKLSGASESFGLNSITMRRYIIKGRAVLLAAKKDKNSLVRKCAFAAYLIRRPPGQTFRGRGRVHKGAWALVVYDAEKLMAWAPESSTVPRPHLFWGDLLEEGSSAEPEALKAPLPPPMRVQQPTRWDTLRANHASNGWVDVVQFVDMFGLRLQGTVKHATMRVLKRLRDKSIDLQDSEACASRGRPPKRARICDLRRCYPDLS